MNNFHVHRINAAPSNHWTDAHPTVQLLLQRTFINVCIVHRVLSYSSPASASLRVILHCTFSTYAHVPWYWGNSCLESYWSYYNRGAPTEQFIIPSQFITVDSAMAQCQHLALYSNQEFEFGRPPFHSIHSLSWQAIKHLNCHIIPLPYQISVQLAD